MFPLRVGYWGFFGLYSVTVFVGERNYSDSSILSTLAMGSLIGLNRSALSSLETPKT